MGDVLNRTKIENFLTTLAAAADSNEMALRALNKYPEFWPPKFKEENILAVGAKTGVIPTTPEQANAFGIAVVSSRLRKAWVTPDKRQREWTLLELREYLSYQMTKRTDEQKGEVPPWAQFEQAIAYMQNHFDLFRYCQNQDCRNYHYYIAPTQRPTKFCSPECAEGGSNE